MAESSFTIRLEGLDVLSRITASTHEQGPYALRRAMNDVIDLAQEDVKADILTKFHQPVYYTRNSTFTLKARTEGDTIKIALKDTSTKSTPPGKYLGHHVLNTQRGHTPFENKLRDMEILGDSEYIVPGSGMDLDSAGNLKKSTLDDILYAATGAGFKRITRQATINRRTARAQKYFLLDRGGKRGIYKRKDEGGIIPVFVFVARPKAYEDIFKFHARVEKIVDDKIGDLFEDRFREALATANRS